jgi:hypothetical protein
VRATFLYAIPSGEWFQLVAFPLHGVDEVSERLQREAEAIAGPGVTLRRVVVADMRGERA